MPKRQQKKRKIAQRKRHPRHPLVWGLLAVAFAGLLMIASFFIQAPPITGNAVSLFSETPAAAATNAAIQQISYFKGGFLLFEFNNVPGIYKLNIEFKDLVKNGRLELREEPRILFPGVAYSKIVVIPLNLGTVGKVEYTLRLQESQLQEKGLRPEEIRLYVATQEITPTLLEKDGEYYIFTATGKGLGDIVIGKKKVDPAPEEAPKESTSLMKEEAPVPEVQEPAVAEEIPLPAAAPPASDVPPRTNLFGKVVAFLKEWWNP